MAGIEIPERMDPRPALNGWAPGDYVCRCRDCGEWFQGAKHAWSCADCAYTKPEKETTATMWAVLALKKKQKLKF